MNPGDTLFIISEFAFGTDIAIEVTRSIPSSLYKLETEVSCWATVPLQHYHSKESRNSLKPTTDRLSPKCLALISIWG